MRTSCVSSVVVALVVAVSATACASDEAIDADFDDAEFDDTDFDESESNGAGEVAADDVECTEDALTGGDDGFAFTSAHRIVAGELGEVCFGVEDAVIVDAWDSLAAIAPPGQLSDLVLFAGFEPDGDGEADTLAFVNTVDADGSGFQMSVNTIDAVADPDELLLTLAHEFTHVFTATSSELDRTDEAFDDCDTYFNGEGCYLPDALMFAWVDEFWDDALLESVDPFEDDPDGADARCDENDGFFGPYAATNPEEDFAEAFSAFVFELEPVTDGQARRLDWIEDRPGLAEFRDRATAAGLTPLDNNFDVCGF